jgi:hypothetical protein
MYRKFPSCSGEPVEFAVHIPSGQVGALTLARTLKSTPHLTVRLAAGNLMTAPASEFRPATESEIGRHHADAALNRPLDISRPTLTHVPIQGRQTEHRPGV